MDPDTDDGKAAAHWGKLDPADTTNRDLVLGVPRMVTEARTRLGPDTTAEQVFEELKQRGLDVTLDDVKTGWDRGA